MKLVVWKNYLGGQILYRSLVLPIKTASLSIQALLSAPNPDDPLANDVAQLWKQNEAQAIRTAR